jgi:hypothetical protein
MLFWPWRVSLARPVSYLRNGVFADLVASLQPELRPALSRRGVHRGEPPQELPKLALRSLGGPRQVGSYCSPGRRLHSHDSRGG